MYNKLYTKILDSSIWLESAHVRLVWLTFLAVMDQDGTVALSGVGNVASRARVSDQEAADAIKILESPDDRNPGQEREGRRIERIPGVGWIVLNAKKYRDLVRAEEIRAATRDRVRRHREKSIRNAPCNANVTSAVAGAQAGTDQGKSKKNVTPPPPSLEPEDEDAPIELAKPLGPVIPPRGLPDFLAMHPRLRFKSDERQDLETALRVWGWEAFEDGMTTLAKKTPKGQTIWRSMLMDWLGENYQLEPKDLAHVR